LRTFTPKPAEVTRTWHVIDATDIVLGRLASQTAILLRGKHKTTFAPHVDGGDSGFPGGLKSTSYTELLAKSPEKAIEKAVRGMIPKTTLGRQQLTKLKVYRGAEHPHSAQKPVMLELMRDGHKRGQVIGGVPTA
jgi:large subunit ribosomal protein L13